MTAIEGSKLGRASESGHWYDEHANLIETVPYKDGRPGKKVTLREARELNLCPGVTSIIKMLDAPGLNIWKQRQVLMEAATCPRLPDESDEDWMRRVEYNAGEKARDAREEGTRIHTALERAACDVDYDARYTDHVRGVQKLLLDKLGKQTWLAEKAVVHGYGYATKLDLHSDEWLVDYKGTDGDQAKLDEALTYREHWMQLAAGRMALRQWHRQHNVDWKLPRCAIVYVSRTHPGACSIVEVTEKYLGRGWELFKGALWSWQADKVYVPIWVCPEWRMMG